VIERPVPARFSVEFILHISLLQYALQKLNRLT
jgi:hypothetical protein